MPHAVRCARFSAGNAYSLPLRAVGIPAGAGVGRSAGRGRPAAGHTEKEPPIPIPIPYPSVPGAYARTVKFMVPAAERATTGNTAA